MRPSYLTLGLLVLVLIGAVGLVVFSTDEPAPALQATATTSPGASSPAVLGKAPFLATHERGTAFTPDGENLAPSYHVQLEALKERLAAAPNDTTQLLKMARLLHDGHDTEEAITYYRRYLALRPEGRQAWLDLAQSLGELDRWDAALDATEALLERFPDDPAALYNLGAIHANTGRMEEARTTWQRVADQQRDPAMRFMAQAALKRLGTMHP